MPQKLTLDIFLKSAHQIHADANYDYSRVKYKNARTKVEVGCPIHGWFLVVPDKFLNEQAGCQKCALVRRAKTRVKTLDVFISQANKVHRGKYDYSKTIYANSHTKIQVICNTHGEFNVTPANHLSGFDCPKCAKRDSFYTQSEFVHKAREVHGKKYSYGDYQNSVTPLAITCPKHGIFEQWPVAHLSGKGCPTCKESKNERRIALWLEEKGIQYERQKSFGTCINPITGRALRFDFFLPDYKLLLEYDGEQHFREASIWNEFSRNGQKALASRRKLDRIKNLWAKSNSFSLLRLSYRHRRTLEKRLEQYLAESHEKR